MSRAPAVLLRLALGVVVAGAVLALPAAALAHVGARATAGDGGSTTVTFTFHHGCGTAATDRLLVQVPAGATEVTAEDPPGWTSAVTPTEISWTGGSIPNGATGTFVAHLHIPGTAGETVFLPTVQGCGAAEEAWITRSDDPEADTAAPRITLVTTQAAAATTAPTGSPTTGAGTATTATPATAPPTTAAPAPASSSTTGAVAGVVIAAVVVAAAVVGFVVVRRSRTDAS